MAMASPNPTGAREVRRSDRNLGGTPRRVLQGIMVIPQAVHQAIADQKTPRGAKKRNK